MASRGGTLSAFHQVNPPSCGPNSSFSIRRILDLPEESAEECAPSSSNSSPAESSPVSLPLVPRVVRPMVLGHYGDQNAPRNGLTHWSEFGLTPYAHHWGYGAVPFREQGFPLGEYI